MASVGRRRKTDRHLPQRVYFRRGAHYYVTRDGKWLPLGKGYSDALIELAKILGSQAPAHTMEQVIAKYEADELAVKAAKTQRNRRHDFKMLKKVFGHMSAEDIEAHHVWTYWKTRGKGEQARHEIRTLSAVLTFARRIGALKRPNPCFGLQLPGSVARDRYVTDEEYLLVRDVAQPMVGYAMDLALLGGMDRATILKLERRHWTGNGFQFERDKTGALQLIEANEEMRLTVQAILRERPQLRRALICNRVGKPYTPDGFETQWQRTMKKAMSAGLKERFHFHDLRAKSASDADSDQEAADRLGHADVKLTRKVYRRLPRRAISLKILDKHE